MSAEKAASPQQSASSFILIHFLPAFFAIRPEPFGNELPSGLSLRVEDKAEWLMARGGQEQRSEKYFI